MNSPVLKQQSTGFIASTVGVQEVTQNQSSQTASSSQYRAW